MKNSVDKITITFCAAILLFSSCATPRATFVVHERLAEPYYERPAPPYGEAIWIPGEWEWRGNHYVYLQGYYTRPQPGHEWVRGHWREVPGGYAWVKGHWS